MEQAIVRVDPRSVLNLSLGFFRRMLLLGLGLATTLLRRLNQTVQHEDSPQLRGMVHKVRHLVRVEEAKA